MRALISVWEKTGLDRFANGLVELDYELANRPAWVLVPLKGLQALLPP